MLHNMHQSMMCGSKMEKVEGGWGRLHNESRGGEIDRACSTHERYEKYIQNVY